MIPPKPTTDAEKIEMLFATCEQLFIRAACLQAILDEAKVPDWPHKTDTLANSAVAISASAEFREIYQRAIEIADQNKRREFLKNANPSGKPV